jgi:hypothetical protein
MDGFMDEWMNGWVDGRMDGYSNLSIAFFHSSLESSRLVRPYPRGVVINQQNEIRSYMP